MHQIWIYSLASVLIVSLISFIGLFAFSIKIKQLKKILIYVVAFAAGALFGSAFLHLLPELIEKSGFTLNIPYLILFGVVLFFSLEKMVHWHHHHMHFGKEFTHPFAIMNLIGDGFHNFLDGLIIGVSYLASIPTGIAVTMAILLHEIPQEISDFGVLLHGGFTKGKALFFNFLSALSAVIGTMVALTLSNYIENIQYFIIPIAIGGFIYVAGSDLIPELHKEFGIKKSLLEIFVFVFGILVMAALLLLE
ncbi:ZIP family metal transporter [Candidatus Pacearchaeota archaeon]|nr:ZIP family metal transporter [Candidatus Pacearchaeota archaeon]